ncbi:MAG: 16S rRNA (adenine(1518)-N(6)/adenine(1519)-N(6))-dimethyltransferase RsmA [Actinomycetota bacterium]
MRGGEVRSLAERYGIHPDKALGQNFLCDPNLARRIVVEAGVGPGDRVLEIGAGLGSLTVPLAATGARVLALEFDRRLVPALEEAVSPWPGVEIVATDAMHADWGHLLSADAPAPATWSMVSNLPYNIATTLVLGMLEHGLPIASYLVMVQREVGERLAAAPGSDAYGAVSVHVAYLAEASSVRRVPATVFWPEPSVESVVVRLVPRSEPPVAIDPSHLFRVVDEGFAQRRKTMRNALRRLGLAAAEADAALTAAGIAADARAETLSLDEFARLAEEVPAA